MQATIIEAQAVSGFILILFLASCYATVWAYIQTATMPPLSEEARQQLQRCRALSAAKNAANVRYNASFGIKRPIRRRQ